MVGRVVVGVVVDDPGYNSVRAGFVNVVGLVDEMVVGLEEEQVVVVVVGNCYWDMQLFDCRGIGLVGFVRKRCWSVSDRR